MVRVLFVCMGNICRSPTAEGVMSKLIADAGRTNEIDIDSAGTGAWHAGEPPDRRALAEARRRGIDISHQRARAVRDTDFAEFDYIVAMDRSNLSQLTQRCPKKYRDRLYLCTSFAPELNEEDVPDPYYGGNDGFRNVFDLVETSLRGLMRDIQAKHL